MLQTDLQAHSGTLTLTLNRAPVNALNDDLYEALHQALQRSASDPAVRAVVLSSGLPKAFCAGADIKAFVHLPPDVAEARHLELLLRCLLDVVAFPKPMVAALQAPAIGAGLMLVCACDEVVMADDTWVSLPESKLNIPTPIGAAIAARRFQVSSLQALVQRAERFNASRCLAQGFADAVVARDEVLATAVSRLTVYQDIASEVYALNKRWLNRDMQALLQAAADMVSH